MLERLLAFSIRQRWLVLAGTLALASFGVQAFDKLPIDAVPDLTTVQVQVLTAAPALGTLDVERLITSPVELTLTGLPHVTEIRSVSRYGVSAVTAVFEDGVDSYFARQLVAERLVRIRDVVPRQYGVPELGPMTTGLGEIYQFEVRGRGQNLMELRSLLDWRIAPRLRMVKGVVEVNTFGGELKTYEVVVDPARLTATNISLEELFTALSKNNRAAGGGVIQRGPEGLLLRGDGLVKSLDEIGNIIVAWRNEVPVYVRDLGETRFGPMLRQGAATRDGRGEVVVGMAMMLTGENSRTVSTAVHREVQSINATLPRGVRIERFYDRTTLVNETIHTVARSLLEGGVLVIVMLFLLLRNIKAGLVAASVIPLSMLGAFIGMRAANVSGNLMSLGAIDFGLVVDGAIILLENAIHHLSERRGSLGRNLTPKERDEVVLHSALEVRSATAFGEIIIALVYVPILALQGVEGKMFHPMALTVLFALTTAFLLSLTFVPALASVILSTATFDKPSPIVSLARRVYEPLLRGTLRRPYLTAGIALGVLAFSTIVATGLGSEFVPRLDEGTFVIEVNRLPSTSLEESIRHTTRIERALKTFPEVRTVVCKTGRPEIANDPMGVEQTDVYVMLKPDVRERDTLIAKMSAALRAAVPGAAFGFSQPIEMRMNELVSGVRSDFAVKVYGEDLHTLARLGAEISRVLHHVRGAEDIKVDRAEGMPVLKAEANRSTLAQRGANASDLLDAVEAVGGVTVDTVLEGRKRFPLRVRIRAESRTDVDAIRRLPVRTANGSFTPLDDVARLRVVDEPVIVSREATERRLFVQANVRGRDLGGFADEAQAKIRARVHLPAGYHIEWGGQFENLRRAQSRLTVVVPLALALIVVLLFITFRAIQPVLLILLNVPFAVTGGILALALRGLPFSISAAVGFIALFGVAVLNGLVLVTQIRMLRRDGVDAKQAAHDGALRRLRPVLTTALVASLGFLPMALAEGAGADVQRPLATVVVGGLLTSTLLTLLVIPTLYTVFAPRDRISIRPSA